MDVETRQALEAEIRRLFDAGDLDGAMTAAIQGYGAELFGFVAALARDHDRAGDVFGAACERMWKGLPRFRWDSSFRVWAYTILRNELLRAAPRIARERAQVPLSAMQLAIEQARSATAPHLKTEIKDELARIRAELDPDDHLLLTLRLDRRLAWNEIARVLAGETEPTNLVRDAAALRKRFERLKERLADRLRGADSA